MPLKLATAQTQTIDTVQITYINLDVRSMLCNVGYQEGYVDQTSGGFRPVNEKVLGLSAQDVQSVLTTASQIVSTQQTPDVYAAVKQALYEHLQQVTGLQGTIQ